jgi:hypothetical protein
MLLLNYLNCLEANDNDSETRRVGPDPDQRQATG